MSYVVKGYKFPQSCSECWLIYPEVGDSGVCILTGKYWENGEDSPSKSRLPECPLVEVPTPHGRLIDADELFCKIDGIKGWDYGDESDMAISAAEALSAIDDSPTVIEAEVSE